MSPGNENHIDWTAPSTPGERCGSGPLRAAAKPPPGDLRRRGSVMDTLLGENNLAAYDAGGNDPYNATGRQFRR